MSPSVLLRGAAAQAGAAARHATREKRRRYGAAVETLAIEVGGRMLPEAVETLRRLAIDARCGTRLHARRGPRLRAHGLRRLLEWEALRGMAALTLASLGSDVHALTRRWCGRAAARGPGPRDAPA